MASDAQLAKAYGLLPDVSLDDLGNGQVALDVDTRTNLVVRDCGHPDASDPEIAVLWGPPSSLAANARDLSGQLSLPQEDCRGLIQAHYRMGAYQNQRWPKGCHTDLKDHGGNDLPSDIFAIKRFTHWERCPAHNLRPCTEEELRGVIAAGVWPFKTVAKLREYWGDLFSLQMSKCARWLADEGWRVKGLLYVPVDDEGPNGEHQQHIKFRDIPGSTTGIGWFPDGRCGDHVDQHIDTIRFGLHPMARLYEHEDGHNNGEEHKFQNQDRHMSVMSYRRPKSGLFYGFSTGEAPYPSWLPRDRSLTSIAEKYGGEPTEWYWPKPDAIPDPPDGDPTERVVVSFNDLGYDWKLTRTKTDDGDGGGDDPIVIW